MRAPSSINRLASTSLLTGGITPVMSAAILGGLSAQSTSALVIDERGHVSAAEMLGFGLGMTLVAWVAIAAVALPWWAAVGEPLILR